jgi:hypothetical protein
MPMPGTDLSYWHQFAVAVVAKCCCFPETVIRPRLRFVSLGRKPCTGQLLSVSVILRCQPDPASHFLARA